MNLQHQLDNKARENGSAKKIKQVYLGKTRKSKELFRKFKNGHKQQNRSGPPKITIPSRDDDKQTQQLQPARTIRTVNDSNIKEHYILLRSLCHHHKENLLQQKQVDQ